MKTDHVSLFLAFFFCTCFTTWVRANEDDDFWLPRWSFRQPLTVRAELIESDLTNFPVLVRLNVTNFDFQTANEQGYDVRFVLPDGTLLAHDRERHDSVNKDALYWIRLPVVSATEDTVFHLYYGNDKAVDSADSHDVWKPNYVGVWHLNDTNGETHLDATSNQLHGKVGGGKEGATPLDGEGVPSIIGDGVRLVANNNDQYIITTNTIINTTQGLTLSVWAQPGSYEMADHGYGVSLLQIGGANWPSYYYTSLSYVGYAPWLLFEYMEARSSVHSSEGGVMSSQRKRGFTTNAWHHVAASFYYHESEQATNTTIKLYLDGVNIGEEIKQGYALRHPLGPRPIGIGARTQSSDSNDNPSYTFSGRLDEARVANTVRGDAWIKASYLNQKTEGELLLYGDLEKQPVGMVFMLR